MAPLNGYAPMHAQYFDLIYKEKAYGHEAEFIDRQLTALGNKGRQLLDLACGTGRHAFEFERIGYQVMGVDINGNLLSRAQDQAKVKNSSVRFSCQDMRKLEVPAQSFDVVTCLFDSLGYVQSDEAIDQVLSAVLHALKPGGFFISEVLHAAAFLGHMDPLRVGRWDFSDGELVRIARTRLDVSRQLFHVDYELLELKKNGTYRADSETQTNRYFMPLEVHGILERQGFQVRTMTAGYTSDTSVTNQTWHLVTVAQKT